MNRPFTLDDDGHRFRLIGSNGSGKLEFPLIDPGPADHGAGILWLDSLDERGRHWVYVRPDDVLKEI